MNASLHDEQPQCFHAVYQRANGFNGSFSSPMSGDFIRLGSEDLLSISSSFTFGFWGFSTGHCGLD